MSITHLVAVGAVSCDVLLGVPFYPAEDSKLRATSFSKRRGGNVGNTLEVLQQLLERGDGGRSQQVELTLVAALPARNSSNIDFISSSFDDQSIANNDEHDMPTVPKRRTLEVNMQYCLYRDGYDEPVTSYIIASEANSSRTIVNHNPLPEMTFQEFKTATDAILPTSKTSSVGNEPRFWFHFEGRIPEIITECMAHLREHPIFADNSGANNSRCKVTISVELEKPGREGLQDLAHLADIVFYSRSWAEGEGYCSAEDCLRRQAKVLGVFRSTASLPNLRLLICTWGSSGACGTAQSDAQCETEAKLNIVNSPAYKRNDAPIVDTTGAGDTFIAGMLCQLMQRYDTVGSTPMSKVLQNEQLRETLDFANALAGRKILQHGLQGLGQDMERRI